MIRHSQGRIPENQALETRNSEMRVSRASGTPRERRSWLAGDEFERRGVQKSRRNRDSLAHHTSEHHLLQETQIRGQRHGVHEAWNARRPDTAFASQEAVHFINPTLEEGGRLPLCDVHAKTWTRSTQKCESIAGVYGLFFELHIGYIRSFCDSGERFSTMFTNPKQLLQPRQIPLRQTLEIPCSAVRFCAAP